MSFNSNTLKRIEKTWLGGVLTLGLMSAVTIDVDGAERTYVQNTAGEQPKPIVAVDNVCAWPNLTLLRDGTIVATIHNQPSHLKLPSDVDCWASEDGSHTWTKRGTPVPRDHPGAARGNVAAGLASNGDLVVIASGWSDPTGEGRGTILAPLISRSQDGGRTWNRNPKPFSQVVVPFGDILEGNDGDLRVALYRGSAGATKVYRSRDDGRTWIEPATLNPKVVIHEPAIFHLGKGKWLAAARLDGLDLYTSDDDAQTWTLRKRLTGKQQHPGHFTRLKDGRVLLSYGNRERPRGVDVRFSDDEGTNWSNPIRVVDFESDGGYPSSVQLADGQIVTAYYARRIAGHDRYHMGVVIWNPAATKRQ
jgi:photosystem II stability/assembly factor-like uncharacterized protein